MQRRQALPLFCLHEVGYYHSPFRHLEEFTKGVGPDSWAVGTFWANHPQHNAPEAQLRTAKLGTRSKDNTIISWPFIVTPNPAARTRLVERVVIMATSRPPRRFRQAPVSAPWDNPCRRSSLVSAPVPVVAPSNMDTALWSANRTASSPHTKLPKQPGLSRPTAS